MLVEADLRDILARRDLGRGEKLLVCLAVKATEPKAVKDIKSLAFSHGLRAAKAWNISSYLGHSNGRASRVAAGWILTKSGLEYIATLGLSKSAVVTHASDALRKHTSSITHLETRAFVDEAIQCFESHLFRAATVLIWVGAVSLLYDHVIGSGLAAFNAEATKRNPKHRIANTKDDLARIRESDFLEIMEGASLIGKSVKKELSVCLDLRNGCGHPNNLKVAEARVASHIETLIQNVYSVY